MSNQNTTTKISLKRIDTCLGMLEDLHEATQDLIKAHSYCEVAADDVNSEDCFNQNVMEELRSMFEAVNRLHYMEEARLKALKSAEECRRAAIKAVNDQKEAVRAREEARKQSQTIYPSAINSISTQSAQ